MTGKLSYMRACAILRKYGYEAYLVGGSVRDMFFKGEPSDFDITTNAIPSMVKSIFEKEGYGVIPVGEKYGTVQVEDIEITTYRSEGKYSDKRHPDEIKWENKLENDLLRRDFTINAIAYDPLSRIYKDPYNGIEDIQKGIIRAVGNPEERFREDPLRMLRMCRFAGKLGFLLEEDTACAAWRLRNLINEIPAERVKEELLKLLSTENIITAIHALKWSGLLKEILPEVARLEFVQQPKIHKYPVLSHTVLVVQGLPKEKPLLRLAGLLHDIGKEEMNADPPYFPSHEKTGAEKLDIIAERLKMSNEEKAYLYFLIRRHLDMFHCKEMTSAGARRYLSKVENLNYLNDLRLLMTSDTFAVGYYRPDLLKQIDTFFKQLSKVIETKQPFTKNDLAITGHDLLAIGVPASPKMGKIQEELLNEVIEKPSRNNKKYLLNRAKEIMELV